MRPLTRFNVLADPPMLLFGSVYYLLERTVGLYFFGTIVTYDFAGFGKVIVLNHMPLKLCLGDILRSWQSIRAVLGN